MDKIYKIVEDQHNICSRFEVPFCLADPGLMAGISKNFGDTGLPMHGLRHPLEGTTGWFLWSGEFSEADDFFQTMHLFHLYESQSPAIPYLGLPPGWRFLLAPDYEDVWFDESLLEV